MAERKKRNNQPPRPKGMDLKGLREVVARSVKNAKPRHGEVVYCLGYVQVESPAWDRIMAELDGLGHMASAEEV